MLRKEKQIIPAVSLKPLRRQFVTEALQKRRNGNINVRKTKDAKIFLLEAGEVSTRQREKSNEGNKES